MITFIEDANLVKMKQGNVIYRIKELNGEFTVEIYSYRYIGWLWWKRIEWTWEPTNAWGGCHRSPLRYASEPYSKTCKSIDEARQMIKEWLSEPVYHYPYGSN